MSLIIVSNDLSEEVHPGDGGEWCSHGNGATERGQRISGEMETLFPGFASAVATAGDTAELLGTLGSLNERLSGRRCLAPYSNVNITAMDGGWIF